MPYFCLLRYFSDLVYATGIIGRPSIEIVQGRVAFYGLAEKVSGNGLSLPL
jgi:hypothetical protein